MTDLSITDQQRQCQCQLIQRIIAQCLSCTQCTAEYTVLLKQMRLQQATKAGDIEVWIAQVVVQRVPDCRTNDGNITTV